MYSRAEDSATISTSPISCYDKNKSGKVSLHATVVIEYYTYALPVREPLDSTFKCSHTFGCSSCRSILSVDE